jgi:hypothetical protein
LIGASATEAAHLWPHVVADWQALARLRPFWR